MLFWCIICYLSQSNPASWVRLWPLTFGPRPLHENINPEVPITKRRKGSIWFEINRDLAATIVKDTLFTQNSNSFVGLFAMWTSIISRPCWQLIRQWCWLTEAWRVDWSRDGPHPAMFGDGTLRRSSLKKIFDGGNWSYIVVNYISLCYIVTRKFDPSALEPLLHIAPNNLVVWARAYCFWTS